MAKQAPETTPEQEIIEGPGPFGGLKLHENEEVRKETKTKDPEAPSFNSNDPRDSFFDLFTCPVINRDIIKKQFLYLITIYVENKKNGEAGDKAQQLLTRLVTLSNSKARAIYIFLQKHKASTAPELCRELLLNEPTLSRNIKNLKNLDLVIEPKGRSRIDYRYRPKEKGRRVKLYALPEASSEDITQAMLRWFEIDNPAHDESIFNQQRLQTQLENKAIKEKLIQDQLIEDFSTQVIADLGDWDMAKLQPLYNTMAGLQIPEEMKHIVSDRVINHFHERNQQ